MRLSYRLRGLWNGRMTGFARLTRTVDRNLTMKKPLPASSCSGRHNRFHHIETPENVTARETYAGSGTATGVLWGNDGYSAPAPRVVWGTATGVLWGNDGWHPWYDVLRPGTATGVLWGNDGGESSVSVHICGTATGVLWGNDGWR